MYVGEEACSHGTVSGWWGRGQPMESILSSYHMDRVTELGFRGLLGGIHYFFYL